MYPDNIKYRKRFVSCYGFKFCTDANYLGGFIGGDESKRDWIKYCTLTWERNIRTIRKMAGKYFQEIYAVVVRAIKLE